MLLLNTLLHEAMKDNETGQGSFGRLLAVPFLAASCSILLASSILDMIRGNSPLESAITMATIGLTLFGSSKALSIKSKSTGVTVGPATTPDA